MPVWFYSETLKQYIHIYSENSIVYQEGFYCRPRISKILEHQFHKQELSITRITVQSYVQKLLDKGFVPSNEETYIREEKLAVTRSII